jgi:hypothetical protein
MNRMTAGLSRVTVLEKSKVWRRPMKKVNKKRSFFLFLAVLFTSLLSVSVSADSEVAQPASLSHRSTNITVDSSELEPFGSNEDSAREERLKFYEDEYTAVGFNDQGDPAVEKRF